MANTKSAAKRARQTTRRTVENRRVTRGVKSAVKVAREAVKDIAAEAAELTRKAASALDKAVKSGQVHRNKANRLKSRLSKSLAPKSK